MNAKQTLTAVFSAVALCLASGTGALASSSATTNKVFISGPLILLFLGFCALVVVVQCIPAIVMFHSMIKGIFSKADKKALTAAANK